MVGINPLPVPEALSSGVTIASEIIVFTVAGAILIYEVRVSDEANNLKMAAAAAAKEEEKRLLEDRFMALESKLVSIADRICAIEKTLEVQLSNEVSFFIYPKLFYSDNY